MIMFNPFTADPVRFTLCHTGLTHHFYPNVTRGDRGKVDTISYFQQITSTFCTTDISHSSKCAENYRLFTRFTERQIFLHLMALRVKYYTL